MVVKFILLYAVLMRTISSDWVKLPEVTRAPKTKVVYKPSSTTPFSDISSSSVLANSDLMSAVFSYDRNKNKFSTSSTTTKSPLMTQVSFKQPQSNTRKYFPTTVTSKSIEFEKRYDQGEFNLEPISIVPVRSDRNKVIYVNYSMPMRVQPMSIEDALEVTLKLPQRESENLQTIPVVEQLPAVTETPEKVSEPTEDVEDDEDDGVTVLDDDGVTVMDDDEGLSSSEEAASDEEYYDDDEEIPQPSSTTTTKAPREVLKKPSSVKPQRRVMQVSKAKPGFHNHLSFANFFKFIKNIQNSFTTRTAKNINDKIRMLRDFRDNLMLTINQRIKSLWKTKSKPKRRTKRTAGGGWSEHGSMDFPSAEGALLSISFLTFAVFLIKLVLVSGHVDRVKFHFITISLSLQQVIRTIKMKKYQYASQYNPDAMQNVVIKRARNTRDVNFIRPDDLLFTQNFLANSLSSFQPILHQSFPKIS